MNDDDRIAYLAGEPTGSIDDSDDRADLDELRALLADRGLWDEPAQGLEDAVVAAVAGAVGARSGRIAAPMPPAVTSTTLPRPGVSSTESSAPVIPIARHRSRVTRSFVLMGAAAAAVIAVVATMVVVTGGQDDRESFSMALEPTEALPGAAGSATLTKFDSGWQIELDATGLPRLDEGDFYQAWLRNEDGTLVPVGTFNEGSDVVLWAGVSPVLYPTLTITREANDNDQGSSGDRVLVGTLSPTDG